MKIDKKAVSAALAPLEQWSHRCHEASIAVVKAKIIPGARVARGHCIGVGGQHSWVTIGDPYADGVQIIDPTLWSYDREIKGIWYGKGGPYRRHTPHGGQGSIWRYGKPTHGGGPTIELTPSFELSEAAKDFLALIEPLDRRGWDLLAHAPVTGWPAAEIIAAIDDTAALSAIVPIDILGMLTDRNPGGLYL